MYIQYFGQLMQRANSLEKTLVQGMKMVSLRAIDHRAEDGAVCLRERVLGFLSIFLKNFIFIGA